MNDAEPVCVIRGHNYEVDSVWINDEDRVITSSCTLCGGTTVETEPNLWNLTSSSRIQKTQSAHTVRDHTHKTDQTAGSILCSGQTTTCK